MTRALSANFRPRQGRLLAGAILAALFVLGCKAGPKVEVDNKIENNAEKADDEQDENQQAVTKGQFLPEAIHGFRS